MAADDELPWTTTRCNRLLRPISSRITTLRKQLDADRRTSFDSLPNKISPTRASFIQPGKHRKPRIFEKALDPDWKPGAKPTAVVKKTYGGRKARNTSAVQPQKAQSQPTTRPGEIAFTPLISRTGNWLQNTPNRESPLRRGHGGIRKPIYARIEQVQILKKQMPANVAKIVEGLLDSYNNLLLATKEGGVTKRKGARSLASACLRKMPGYIELEEHFAEEERDISNEIYTHLEDTYESAPGMGWPRFKQVVRAHGTSLICDAFADRTLGLESLKVIISCCMSLSAYDEAETILWTYVSILKPLPLPSNLQADLFDPTTSVYMAILRALVHRSGRNQLLYDQLEYLVSQELLPIKWLATECMRSEWFRIVQALSDGDPRTSENAFRLLETVISSGIGLPDDSIMEAAEIDIVSKVLRPSTRKELREALDTTISSLLTLLSSIALASQCNSEHSGKLTSERATTMLDSLVIGITKREDLRFDLDLLKPSPENIQTFSQRAMWVVAASFVARLGGCRSAPGLVSLDMSEFNWAFDWIAKQYSWEGVDFSKILGTLPGFISGTARCAGRPLKDDGFDQLQILVEALLGGLELRLPHKLWNSRRLALESCFEFAHATNDAQHLAFARRIEKTMSEKGRVILTQTTSDSPSITGGFRWEEGIGEWVTCTPFVKKPKPVAKNPIRTLDLLPTPAPSETETAFSDANIDDGPLHDIDDESMSDYDDALQSSPVKQMPRKLLKRKCASSPMVIIPAKRTRRTTSDFPIPYYPVLPEDRSRIEPDVEHGTKGCRRSNREKKKTGNNIAKLRAKRSSTFLRKNYCELYQSSDEDMGNSSEDVDELAKTPYLQSKKRRAAQQGREEGVKRSRRAPSKTWTSLKDAEVVNSEDELSFDC